MGVIVAKISVLVKISVFAKDSRVDDCAYILETVPMIQDHSFEASCSEDAALPFVGGIKIKRVKP